MRHSVPPEGLKRSPARREIRPGLNGLAESPQKKTPCSMPDTRKMHNVRISGISGQGHRSPPRLLLLQGLTDRRHIKLNFFPLRLEKHDAPRYIITEHSGNRIAGKVIKSFKDKETEAVYNGERSRKLPGDIQTAARRKMRMLNAATAPEDLSTPPGNHFEALTGRPGFFSIRVNIQWRVTFSWSDGAENVKIEDYH